MSNPDPTAEPGKASRRTFIKAAGAAAVAAGAVGPTLGAEKPVEKRGLAPSGCENAGKSEQPRGACPPFSTRCEDKSGTKPAVVGTGEHTYECIHNWGQLPDHIQWGETH